MKLPKPTPAEKQAIRRAVHARAGGRCELRRSRDCSWPVVMPLEGSLMERMHLVHGRSKGPWGFRESGENFLLCGCFFCHQQVHQYGGRLVRPDRPVLKVEGYDA